ncbi:TolC family protein, partial [Pseudomonas viridiflava]|uniref:TolC family protein n=1 Tax=Pseudomonas viridiflava TaxID=33069 RepID=UPI0013C34F93
AELSALMSLPPGTTMVLADTAEPVLPLLTSDINRLEQLAMENRPEIKEEWYRKRVSQADLNVAKAQLWPNVSVDFGYKHDSNAYLYNNGWTDTGLQVSMNLIRLLQHPALNRTQESQATTHDPRRIT